ncbi:MAG: HD domain-containing protein [Desulfohalobiaceae bacterium]
MQDNPRLNQQLQFLLQIDSLKEVFRQSYLLNSRRKENSSEHSWHVAIMAMLLAEHADQKADICRVVCMLLVHDLVEIYAGDTYCYDQQGNQDKPALEKDAANRLFGILPQDQEGWLRGLWEEFEAGQTPEARLAHAVDRLMPLLHNFHTQGISWQEHGVSQDQVQTRMAKVQQGSALLWEYAQQIIEAAVDQGFLKPDQGQQ